MGERRRRGADRVELIQAQSADEPEWAPLPATPPPVAPPPSSTRRRAWIVLAAVGAIVAIIVVANVVGGPDERRATPPTTVIAPTTTVAPTSTAASSTPATGSAGTGTATAPGGAAPVVVADPPPGYAVASATRFDLGSEQTDGQLWTTWGTDERAGTWVAITVWPTDEPWMTTGTSRVWLSTGVGVVNRYADGTIALDAERAGHHVAVLANRLDVPALAAVMDTVQFSGDHLSGSAAVGDLGLRLANESTGSTADAPRGEASSIGFVSTSDPQQWIQIVTGRSLGTFDRAMRSFLMRDPMAVVVGGGHLATFGMDGRVPDRAVPIAVVDVDGQEVELTGGSSVRDLMNVAVTLRTGTEDDWQALVDRSKSLHSADVSSSELTINDGRMRTGTPWRAELIVTDRQPTLVVAAFDVPSPDGHAVATTSGAAALATPDTPGIQAFASTTGVVLVAHVGRDQPGAELRVAVADGAYHSTVVDPGPAAPALFAATGFSELASYHAELVGAGGLVLATLDDT